MATLFTFIWLYHFIDIDCYEFGRKKEKQNACRTREINKLLQYAVLCVCIHVQLLRGYEEEDILFQGLIQLFSLHFMLC